MNRRLHRIERGAQSIGSGITEVTSRAGVSRATIALGKRTGSMSDEILTRLEIALRLIAMDRRRAADRLLSITAL